MKRISDKRKTELAEYAKAKKLAIEQAQSNGTFCCFFCGQPFYETPDWHHLSGRENERLVDTENLVFVHRYCHRHWHSTPLSQMVNEPWWSVFVRGLENYPDVLKNIQRNLEK